MSFEPKPADVMKLRNETGLPMMECKKALIETQGDVEKAKDLLRKKLGAKMDARSDRAAGEGRVAVAVGADGRAAAIVELRAETDFTAKNDGFVSMAKAVAEMALAEHDGEVALSEGIKKAVDGVRISTGENVSYARGHKLSGGGQTAFGSYIHHDGKLGVLLQGEGSLSEETLRSICMHIAASPITPQGITPNDIPQHIADKERTFAIEQAMESGKPREIAEKMVEGKMRKFFEEVALLEQPFVMDPTKKVKEMLPKDASIVAFLRWKVGQG